MTSPKRTTWWPDSGGTWFEALGIGLLYFVSARLGQVLGIPPSNITPVWLPSGIMLALVLVRGWYLWPGIAMGAFLGNVWPFLDFGDPAILLRATGSGLCNAVGDILSCAVAGYIIYRECGTNLPFLHNRLLAKFLLYGVVLNSLASTLFGVTGLAAVGFVSWGEYPFLFTTWFTGDAVGALVLTPALLLLFSPIPELEALSRTRLLFASAWLVVVLVIGLATMDIFGKAGVSAFVAVPLLIGLAFRFGIRVALLGMLLINLVAVLVTASGAGPFHDHDLYTSLVELQVFLACLSVTTLLLCAQMMEQKRAHARADELRRMAERASKIKTDFLATMSHEIRTPLTGLLGLTTLLQKTDLDPEQEKYVSTLYECSEDLLSIVSDILDISKIESGSLEVQTVTFAPRQMLVKVMALFAGPVANKGLETRIEVLDDVPEALVGDVGKVRQILINLVANAIRSTQEGGLTLHCGYRPEPEPTLWLRVSDTGSGMDEDTMKRLFERYSHDSLGMYGQLGGAGLGLHICHRLATLLGGHLEVESTLGQGTSVTVTMPVAVAETEARPAGAAVPVLVPAARPLQPQEHRLLVVEDNKMIQMVISRILRQAGYEVDIAGDGVDAVAACHEREYHLVLMDCRMPRMDGLQATTEIHGSHPALPIIGLSANATAEDRDQCLAVGMNDFLAKPVSAATLLQTVERVLGGDYEDSPSMAKDPVKPAATPCPDQA